MPIALDLQLSTDSGVRVEVQSDGAKFIRVILRDAKHRRYKDVGKLFFVSLCIMQGIHDIAYGHGCNY